MDPTANLNELRRLYVDGGGAVKAKTGMRPNRHVNPRKVAKEWLQVRTNDFGLLITMVEAKVKELQSQVTHIYEE